MLVRIDSCFKFFALPEEIRPQAQLVAASAAARARDMMHIKDYEALAAVALRFKPRQIFEFGTYMGVTANFFLELLPDTRVVSIAYNNHRWRFWRRRFNNSELSYKQIGSAVDPAWRSRFTQLYGDSHKLNARSVLDKYGAFDLVFIDGDHSWEGVLQDTLLAKNIVTESGVICWHDANPKPKYMDVRRFLEDNLSLTAVATRDDYIGGIACWTAELEQRLHSNSIHNRPVEQVDGRNDVETSG